MANEKCPECDQMAESAISALVPADISARAALAGKTVAELYPHVSWSIKTFAAHNAACGLPCAKAMSQAEKVAADGQFHSPSHCPLCFPVPVPTPELEQ